MMIRRRKVSHFGLHWPIVVVVATSQQRREGGRGYGKFERRFDLHKLTCCDLLVGGCQYSTFSGALEIILMWC